MDETNEPEELTPQQKILSAQLELVIAVSFWSTASDEFRQQVAVEWGLEGYTRQNLYNDLADILKLIGLEIEFVSDDNLPLMGVYT